MLSSAMIVFFHINHSVTLQVKNCPVVNHVKNRTGNGCA